MFNFNIIETFKIQINTNKKNNDKRIAGVICEGKNSTFIDCSGFGSNAGMIDKGENTVSINSKWQSTGKK